MSMTLTSSSWARMAAAAALTLGSLAAAPAIAAPSEGPWLVRVRAVNIDPANDDTVPGLDVTVNSKVIPELDISYFFTPNIAAELILTYPQKHNVYANGNKIGTLRHLPPTLTLQYHFIPDGKFRPYLGAGLNYTHFSTVDLPAPLTVDKNSVGLALQAGIDIKVAKNVFLNVDIKKVQIRTDLKSGGTNLGTLKVDPLLVGVGLGYRF